MRVRARLETEMEKVMQERWCIRNMIARFPLTEAIVVIKNINSLNGFTTKFYPHEMSTIIIPSL